MKPVASLLAAAIAANCSAVLIKHIDAGNVMHGPVTSTLPPDYPLTFTLTDGAQIIGGPNGLILTMKLCDGKAILEVSGP